MTNNRSEYEPTIGLEIHAELKTRTKMFCDSKNDPDEKRPNVNVCPVCMGYPGTLPVINKEAVKSVIKVGIALGGTVANFSEFDRKNYFYPDIPKGYQISQYKHPLIFGGELCGIKIRRVHLEEDTAKSQHEGDWSLIDFNRAGIPLMELVTEPIIRSGKEAADFAKELQLLLTALGVAEANMEKGEMRIEANISVAQKSKVKGQKLGTKVEVKNLNSFRAMERAIVYEIERQKSILEKGEKIIQETRGFDESTGETFSQRQKEESHDYRYFPDPDLPKLEVSSVEDLSEKNIKKELPELPMARRERLTRDFRLTKEEVNFYASTKWGDYFEKAVGHEKSDKKIIKLISNFISSDLIGLQNKNLSEETKALPEEIWALSIMFSKGELSSRGAKNILAILHKKGGKARKVAEENKLIQQNDLTSLKDIVKEVMEINPKVAEDYKGGKIASVQFLIGQCMKASKGAGNPQIFKKLLSEILRG